MRIVALEEHFTVPELVARIDKAVIQRRGFGPRTPPKSGRSPTELLPEIGDWRLSSMDESGISVQVLSVNGPGPDLVPGAEGVALARAFNDHLAGVVKARPDRFAGFAALPTQSPEEAAREFERAVRQLGFCGALVNGTTEGRFLDHPSFDPVLAAAVQLDVPIYIHPHLAPAGVREAYYAGLPGGTSRVLEAAGWGWHSETAIHVLRMVLSGAFERHPKLKIIIGHMGEMLPMMLARIDNVFQRDVDHLTRPISTQILEQVWITTSGIFTEPPFYTALMTFGLDRIVFSVDYPYAKNAAGRAFLDRLALSPADKAKLAHGNADRLLKLRA